MRIKRKVRSHTNSSITKFTAVSTIEKAINLALHYEPRHPLAGGPLRPRRSLPPPFGDLLGVISAGKIRWRLQAADIRALRSEQTRYRNSSNIIKL